MRAILVALSLLIGLPTFAGDEFTRTKIPFSKLSEKTQNAILDIKIKSKQFSEGCSDEAWDLGKSVLFHLAADAACAGSAIAAVESAGLATELAVVSCGIGLPVATIDVFDNYGKWNECKEFVSFHEKYKKYCDGKGIFVHIYQDALICVSDDLSVPIVRIDLRKEKPVVELLKVKR